MKRWLPWLLYAGCALFGIVLIASLWIAWVWREAPPVTELPWPVADTSQERVAEVVAETGVAVTATWLGVSTLLFDDGETQILVDGMFTRPGPHEIVFGALRSDIANINYVMDEYRIDRLAAIVPVHSHFDHAMDVGNVANRSSAVILGSESTANVARGADVPVDQYQILADGESRHFGDFAITVFQSAHAPTGGGDGWFPGIIGEPLRQPARVWSWRGGAALTVVIAHPSGTALVQGSAGYIPERLAGVRADVAFVSVAGLASLGADYTNSYWQQVVEQTDAKWAVALHFDDFTQPFGELRLLPSVADDAALSADWVEAAATESGIPIYRPPFGIPIPLF